MLPLAHIYVSTKVVNRKSSLLVFGSVLPDIAWSSQSGIGRQQIHNSPVEFYDYFSKNFPDYVDLALGVRLHSGVEKGADFYSDDPETGFAKIEGRKIEQEVCELLNEPKGEITLVLAHNFIEAGVDLLLNEHDSSILNLYKDSLSKLDFTKISFYLAEYLNLPKETLESELKNFIYFIGPSAYELLPQSLVERMQLLIKTRMEKEPQEDEIKKIVFRSKEIVNDKYLSYLSHAVDNMKRDFSEFID